MNTASPESYVAGVLKGDRRALSKTITLVESALDQHKDAARAILDRLLPHAR